MKVLTSQQLSYIHKARVAKLATTNEDSSIQLVPVVFANSGERIYFVVDLKKKKSDRLTRIRNISRTCKASLLIDHYSEKWEDLSYLLLYCQATVIGPGENPKEKYLAAKKLKEKYPQYSEGPYFPEKVNGAVFVRLRPERAIFWQNLR